ncbi:TBC1 domain family member 25 isoform X3 [Amblyomma americanum]
MPSSRRRSDPAARRWAPEGFETALGCARITMHVYYKTGVCVDAFLAIAHGKFEGSHGPTEHRKFSLDPQITSFEVLQNLLARAFDIRGEFTVSYLARDDEGGDAYIGLLSDWDLDAAFLSSSEPCLKLRVEPKPYDKSLAEWDVVTPGDMAKAEATPKSSLTGSFFSQMEKTLTRFQKVLNLASLQDSAAEQSIISLPWTSSAPPSSQQQQEAARSPLGDREFRACLDGEGRLLKPRELRLAVYQGGVEPSLRKVVWKHILNVYPEGLTGRQRLAYMRRKSDQYLQLRSSWKNLMEKPGYSSDIQLVTNMVRKDVLRTDRTHPFYAGGDDNANVVALFNLLTTFALNHPGLSYCQGMSDLASPLLVVMRDEPHAYVCFCALMRRLAPNFNLDGEAMTLKFQHLSDLVEHFDPVFFRYLEERGAQDLLFCYRWLLLELKREFAFDDALRMLEVLWSSLPPAPPEGELELYERPYAGEPRLPAARGGNPYCKVRAIRRQSSGSAHASPASSSASTVREEEQQPSSEDEDSSSQAYEPISTTMTRELSMELDSLNRRLRGDCATAWCNGAGGDAQQQQLNGTKLRRSSDSEDSDESRRAASNHASEGYVSEEGGASSREASTEDSGVVSNPRPWADDAAAVSAPKQRGGVRARLPRPQELGGGNPFMMFLCLTLLLQHRDVIMRNGMDYNELAMHFDKMVRRHHLHRVLHQTRALFAEYLRLGWDSEPWEEEHPHV